MRERANALYNKQFSELAPQETADLSGLEQAKQNAFESISTGANRRGMFYSGVPIAEQSKYVGENYLPSIASLKNRYAGIRGNLYQTLAQTLGSYDTEANSRANDIYQQELARDEQIRQFNETLAAQERAAAASRASGGGGGGAFTPAANSASRSNTGVLGASVSVKPADQLLYNQMFVKGDGSLWSSNDLRSDYNATLASAKNGNARDQQKIRMYHSVRPDLFGAQPPIALGAIKPASGGTQTTLPVSNKVPTSNLLRPFGV